MTATSNFPFLLDVVDMIPPSASAETAQNSEPSIGVNPIDPTQIWAASFAQLQAARSCDLSAGSEHPHNGDFLFIWHAPEAKEKPNQSLARKGPPGGVPSGFCLPQEMSGTNSP